MKYTRLHFALPLQLLQDHDEREINAVCQEIAYIGV